MAKRKPPGRTSPARKRSSRQAAPARQPSFAAWCVAVIVIVGLIAGVSWLNQPTAKKQLHAWTQKKQPASHMTIKKIAKTTKPKAEFQFYTALPEGGLSPLKAANTAKPVAPATKATPLATEKITTKAIASTAKKPAAYFLQVASFPQYADANRVKAELLLEAYNANIQKTQVKGKDWYRVVVGPYQTTAMMTEAQNNLSKMHYKALRLESR